MKLRAACVVLGFLSLAQLTFAQTTAETASALPRLVRFGGTVKDLNGSALTGVVGITFALYSEQTGGGALWLETQNVTADSSGHYVAVLGSTKLDGVPVELFTSEQAHWVGVQVSGQTEQPRVLLVSAPYALKAGDAETVGGLPPSAFVLNTRVSGSGGRMNNGAPSSPSSSRAVPPSSSNVTTTGGTVNKIPLFTTSTNIQNSILTQTGTTGVSAAGNLTATGIVTGSSFQIGSNLFAFGSYTNANAFLGFAGNSKTTGTYNTASGVGALQANTTGSYNTATGRSALQANTSGNYNTATGRGTLQANTIGCCNTAGGFEALYFNTTGQSNTANGFYALYSNTTGAYNAANGAYALYFNTTGPYNTASGYKALYSNTTGQYNTASGYQALYSNTTGGSNTASGYQALYSNTTGPYNTASGLQSLYSNTTGDRNTASGYLALFSNTIGYDNTASGFAALNLNTSGIYNTAYGSFALSSNTESYNTAVGFEVLLDNTTGTYNTASGFQALRYNNGSNNTAVGALAEYYNTTGSNNTAVGSQAGESLTTGSNNTAVGQSAGGVTTGSNNTAVGYQAGGVITGSNNIDIGNQGTTSDSGAIRIGTAGTQTSAFIAGIYGAATSVNNAVPVLIDSNGNLGTVSSSRRYKEDIQDMGDASSGLMRLRPVTFRYKKPFDDGSQPVQYGLIAEEVAEVYPDMVARSAHGQIETVKYQLLDPMLLNEVQRQQAEIRELQERLSKMEAALAAVSRAESR
jgi:trimeric autotransporter adhesin